MEKITPQPEYDALNEFDVANNVEPARTIAERIAGKYGVGTVPSLVDEISHAIEDAMEMGQRRGLLIPNKTRPAFDHEGSIRTV